MVFDLNSTYGYSSFKSELTSVNVEGTLNMFS